MGPLKPRGVQRFSQGQKAAKWWLVGGLQTPYSAPEYVCGGGCASLIQNVRDLI